VHSNGLDPVRIVRLKKHSAGFFAAALFIRSWVCRRRLLRTGDSLQRVLGLTPCRSDDFESARRGFLYEVLHRP